MITYFVFDDDLKPDEAGDVELIKLEPGEVVLSGPEAQAIYHSLLRQWVQGDNYELIRSAMAKIAKQYGKEL